MLQSKFSSFRRGRSWVDINALFPGLSYGYGGDLNYEVLDDQLYDTRIYVSGCTTRLDFFNPDYAKSYPVKTNVFNGHLQPPHHFAVTSIRLDGISSDLSPGVASLTIGNKEYGVRPLLSYAIKGRGLTFKIPLLIQPVMNIGFAIKWETAVMIRSFTWRSGTIGVDVPIRVVLDGFRARPIQ